MPSSAAQIVDAVYLVAVGKDSEVNRDVLVYRRRVAVNMDYLRTAGEL